MNLINKKKSRKDFTSYQIFQESGGLKMPQAYCVRCKKKVEIKNPQKVKLKNGRPATKGDCPNCSTKVFRIGA